MTTKRCRKCQLVKSTSEFYNHATHHLCKDCQTLNVRKHQEIGKKILQDLAQEIGECQNCKRVFSLEEREFFEFDHIDPTLKQKRDTSAAWVKAHIKEFHEKVRPNLQLLCIKCHKEKTKKDIARGGGSHRKIHGLTPPPQVIDPGWNLYNPIPVGAPDELHFGYIHLDREGEWWTVRDIDGNLISYEPRSNFIKQ